MKKSLFAIISILILSGCMGNNASNSTPIVNSEGLSGFGEFIIGSTYQENEQRLQQAHEYISVPYWIGHGIEISEMPDLKAYNLNYTVANLLHTDMSVTFYKDTLVYIQFGGLCKSDVKEAFRLKYGDVDGYSSKSRESYTWVGEIATAEYLRDNAYNVESFEIHPTYRDIKTELSEIAKNIKEHKNNALDNALIEAL